MSPNGVPDNNPGMCRNQESSQQPFGARTDAQPTELPWPGGMTIFLKHQKQGSVYHITYCNSFTTSAAVAVAFLKDYDCPRQMVPQAQLGLVLDGQGHADEGGASYSGPRMPRSREDALRWLSPFPKRWVCTHPWPPRRKCTGVTGGPDSHQFLCGPSLRGKPRW